MFNLVSRHEKGVKNSTVSAQKIAQKTYKPVGTKICDKTPKASIILQKTIYSYFGIYIKEYKMKEVSIV